MRGDFPASVLGRVSLTLLMTCGGGCAVHPILPPTAKPIAATHLVAGSVILANPTVQIEHLSPTAAGWSTGASRTTPQQGDLEASLHASAKAAAVALGVPVVDCHDATDDQLRICKELDPLVVHLAQGSIRAGIRPPLRHASDEQAGCAVLATLLHVELGPGDYYNSFTGQMGSESSTSAFHAALTRCETGEVLWTNEVLLREAPDARNSGYAEALHALFEGAMPPK